MSQDTGGTCRLHAVLFKGYRERRHTSLRLSLQSSCRLYCLLQHRCGLNLDLRICQPTELCVCCGLTCVAGLIIAGCIGDQTLSQHYLSTLIAAHASALAIHCLEDADVVDTGLSQGSRSHLSLNTLVVNPDVLPPGAVANRLQY